MQILGHSRVAATLRYGKPTKDDLRAALEDASHMRCGVPSTLAPNSCMRRRRSHRSHWWPTWAAVGTAR